MTTLTNVLDVMYGDDCSHLLWKDDKLWIEVLIGDISTDLTWLLDEHVRYIEAGAQLSTADTDKVVYSLPTPRCLPNNIDLILNFLEKEGFNTTVEGWQNYIVFRTNATNLSTIDQFQYLQKHLDKSHFIRDEFHVPLSSLVLELGCDILLETVFVVPCGKRTTIHRTIRSAIQTVKSILTRSDCQDEAERVNFLNHKSILGSKGWEHTSIIPTKIQG